MRSDARKRAAEHAHDIDTGREALALADLAYDAYHAKTSDGEEAWDIRIAEAAIAAGWVHKNTAADAVLAEARQLCCGNNPSTHHAATAKHSERMAFAGDLARAVSAGHAS